MNAFFFEHPWQIGLLGLAITAMAVIAWLQSGSRWLAIAAWLGLLVTGALVAVNVSVETPREQVTRFLYQTADALQRNDHESVRAVVYPGASLSVIQAVEALPKYRFELAQVKRVQEIQLLPRRTPPRAVARIQVLITVVDADRSYHLPRYVELTLCYHQGRWTVYDYIHDDWLRAYRRAG
jgi:hypothetical protein